MKVDAAAPTTGDNAAVTGSAWRTANATVTLVATDTGGSNLATTYYTIDGTTPTTGSTTGTTISLTVDGVYTIKYFSVDNACNVESVKTASTQIRIDRTLPVNAFTLAAPNGAFLTGNTLYLRSASAGSFSLVNTVTDAVSGPASATFPSIDGATWDHLGQTVTTPAGGPYASAYGWSSGATTPSPAETTFTSADVAGNVSTESVLTFVSDNAAPTGGALTVNGTAATANGSTSTTSTGFSIGARTNYSEAQGSTASGLASSVLTVQSATLTGSSTCGAPGSGGPYTSATTIAGAANPAISSGYCYVYALKGTDHVGNAVSISTTVTVPNYRFTVSTPGTPTAGTAFGVTIRLQANGIDTTTYNGGAYTGAKSLAFTGPGTSPTGAAPTYPASVTFTNGVATLPAGAITLFGAGSTTLTATETAATPDITGVSASFTVAAGAASKLAWTSLGAANGALVASPCLFNCSWASIGNNTVLGGSVSVMDGYGNPVRTSAPVIRSRSARTAGATGSFTAPARPPARSPSPLARLDPASTVPFGYRSGTWQLVAGHVTASARLHTATLTLSK